MAGQQTAPPSARRAETTYTQHGIERLDPYSWMHDVGSEESQANLRAERAFYDAATAHLGPLAQGLTKAMSARIPPTEVSVTRDRCAFVYYTIRREGSDYGEIRRFRRTIATETGPTERSDDEIVLDLEQLRGESAHLELGVCEVSPNEQLLAYSVDVTGDEVYELRFRDLRTGDDLPDRIPRSYYSAAWSSDSGSLFYTVHDEAYRPFEVRRHVLGDTNGDDLVFREDDVKYDVEVRGCRSGRLVVVHTANRDTSEEWLVDAEHPDEAPRCVEPRRSGLEYYVEHAPSPGEDRLTVLTNDDAIEYQVMVTPTAAPGHENWRPLVPEDPSVRIERVDAFAEHLVLSVRTGGLPQLIVTDVDGAVLHRLDPPAAGSVQLGDNDLWETPSIVVERQSFSEPAIWYDVDLATGAATERHRADVPGYDPAAYVSERIEVPARDGVPIPVTLVRRTDTPLDGTAPCLMYGYGAYEAIFEAEFDVPLSVLLDQGVVYAHAHIRGGGEGGRRWWLDGRLEHKHHTFDDYVDVAESIGGRLVDGDRIASRGLSAGGLLQAAVFSRAPRVWRAVVAEVPFVDVVTTMLDPTIPLTPNEWDEWGDPRRAEDFAWMLAYSPYDNIPPAGGRPDLLVTGALHDARVMVWEPAKWSAALRASDPEWAPRCLFRVDLGEGAHAGPTGRFARLTYEAEIYAWVLDRLGH